MSSFDAADADQRAREWAFSTLRVIDSDMQVIERYISSLEVVERAILGLMHKLAHHVSFEARSSLMAKERRRLKQHKTMLMLGGWAERKRLRQVLAKAVRAWWEALAESGWTQVLHVRDFSKSRLVLLVWKHVALLNSTVRQVLSSSLLGRVLRRTIGAAWSRWCYSARQAGARRGKLASRVGQRRRKQLWCVWQCWLHARDEAWATAALEMRASRKFKTTGSMRCADTFYAIVKCVSRRKWLRKTVMMMARRSTSWRLSLLWHAWDGSRQQQRLRRQREDRLVTAIMTRRTVRYFAAWSSLVLRQRNRLRLAATLSRAVAARHRAREVEVVRHAVALWRRLVCVGKGLRWRAVVFRRWRKKRFTHRWKAAVHGQAKPALFECSASLHLDATPSWLLARVRLKQFGLQRQGVASWRSLVASSKMVDLKVAFCLRGRRRRVFEDWQAVVGEGKEAKRRVQRVMAAWNKGQMRSKERFFGVWTNIYLRKRRLHRICHRIGFQCSLRLAMGAFRMWMRYFEEMLEDKAEEHRRPHANTQMERNLVLAALQRWRGRLLALKRAEAKSAKASRHWRIRAQSLALRRLQHYFSCQKRLSAAARKILQRWRFLGVARTLYTWRDCAHVRRLTDIAAMKRHQRCLVHSLRVLKAQVSLAEDWRAMGAKVRGRWLQRQAEACLVSWCHLARRRQVLRKAGRKITSKCKCLRLSSGIARWLEAVGESRRLQREASESRSQRLEGEVSTLSLLAAALEARMRRRLLMCTAWRVWWSCACRRRRIMIKVEEHVCLLTRRKLSRCLATFWQDVKRQQHVTLLMSRIEKRRDRRWCWYGIVGWMCHLGAARAAAAAEDSQARLQRKALQHALQQWAMLILAEHVQREERARYRHKSIVRMLRGSSEVKLKILSLNGQWLVPGAHVTPLLTVISCMAPALGHTLTFRYCCISQKPFLAGNCRWKGATRCKRFKKRDRSWRGRACSRGRQPSLLVPASRPPLEGGQSACVQKRYPQSF